MVPSRGVKSQVVLQKKDNEAVKKHTHTHSSLKYYHFITHQVMREGSGRVRTVREYSKTNQSQGLEKVSISGNRQELKSHSKWKLTFKYAP